MPQTSAPATEAVEALFDEHARFLARVIERMSGPGPHVEDMLQEVFIAAHKKRGEVAAATDARAWLYGAARNLVLHHHRSEGRRSRLVDRVRIGTTTLGVPLPDEVMRQREAALRVREALLELSEKQREVLILYEFEEMSGVQIAAFLAIPVKTVHSRIRLARAAFANVLAKRETT